MGAQDYPAAGGDDQALTTGKVIEQLRLCLAEGFPTLGGNPLVDLLAGQSDQTFVHVYKREVVAPGKQPADETFARSTKTDEGDVGTSFHCPSHAKIVIIHF